MIIALLVILFISSPVMAGVTPDAHSESGCLGCSSDSWPHTVTGSDATLVCSAIKGDTRTVSTFTFNAVTLVQHATKSTGGGTYILEMWRRILGAGDATPHTVAIALNGVATSLASGCSSFSDMHQTTPLGTAQNNTNEDDLTTSPPSLTVPPNGLAYDVVFFVNGDDGCIAPTPGGSQTLRFDVCADGGPNASAILAASTRATTGTMPWTNLDAAYQGQIAVPISEAITGGSTRRGGVMVIE